MTSSYYSLHHPHQLSTDDDFFDLLILLFFAVFRNQHGKFELLNLAHWNLNFGTFFPQFKKRFFIPYVVLDAVFIVLTFIGCTVGFLASITHLFRVSFIFLVIKLYIEYCVTSLFRDYRESKPKNKTVENSETGIPGSPLAEDAEDLPALV